MTAAFDRVSEIMYTFEYGVWVSDRQRLCGVFGFTNINFGCVLIVYLDAFVYSYNNIGFSFSWTIVCVVGMDYFYIML